VKNYNSKSSTAKTASAVFVCKSTAVFFFMLLELLSKNLVFLHRSTQIIEVERSYFRQWQYIPYALSVKFFFTNRKKNIEDNKKCKLAYAKVELRGPCSRVPADLRYFTSTNFIVLALSPASHTESRPEVKTLASQKAQPRNVWSASKRAGDLHSHLHDNQVSGFLRVKTRLKRDLRGIAAKTTAKIETNKVLPGDFL
jgi:hypothetical protein